MGQYLQRAFDAASGDIIVSNPATGEELARVPCASAQDVRAAVARARVAGAAWGALPVAKRAAQLGRVADVLVARIDDIVDLLVVEMGKTRQEALTMEVMVVADLIRYFAAQAPKILAPQPIPLHLMKHRASYIHYAPRGVVGVISPWNFPFSIPMGECMMALFAGNACVLKPSDVTPLVAGLAAELARDAGLPADLFTVVHGRGDVGAALIDAGIDYCVFTGSVATGRKVAAACGERLIPVTLELGGKAPAVVCADADLARAVAAVAWGGLANSGQVCASVERVYVAAPIYDEFVRLLTDLVGSLRQGDGRSAETDIGAMAWERQLEILEAHVKDAIGKGANVRVGAGARLTGPGMFFPPTVLTEVTHEMTVMRAEAFGPILPIMKFEAEAEAVALANDSKLGLLAYVFSRDVSRARGLAEQIEAGTVMINDVLGTFGCPETPWAGVKQSGIGRTHSADGLRDLCQARHVNYDRISTKRELWWYPYSDKTYALLRRATRLLWGKRFWQR